MSIAYVIHCDADLDFVNNNLLRSLPCNGFERWVSSTSLKDRPDLPVAGAMKACDVIFVVISQQAAESTTVHSEIKEACINPTSAIAIQKEHLSDEECARFPKEVWLFPLVDFTKPEPEVRKELAALLPIPGMDDTTLDSVAKHIEWNEEIFSDALAGVLKLHDYNQADMLITNFAHHIEHSSEPYPTKAANKDLTTLRRKRQFKLMRRYGDAVMASGNKDAKVRRQYSQALIEQREFEQALAMLKSIVADPNTVADEVAEASGLIGRTYKQQYMDNPEAPGSPDALRKAIEAYGAIYDEDETKIWHGVNKASCIVRGHRDGVTGLDLSEAKKIAERLLQRINQLEETNKIEMWDYATRIEALIILKQYDEAMTALDKYISHPEMDAFEVSSTYRQFDQLLQLGNDPLGKPILDRLFDAVQRLRGLDFAAQPAPAAAPFINESFSLGPVAPPVRPLLIRVADPDWQPGSVSDLVTEGRLGTIVSAHGSDASVKELLSDPDVISVNDSPAAGTNDCQRSKPFIQIVDPYTSPTGPYSENGARALIAVIDNGIDVLHQAFQNNSKTRIVGIWDQTDSTGTAPAPFNYGTYHSADQINSYIDEKKVPAKLGRNINGEGHGTHVASIAAGNKAVNFAGGVAPEAQILVVIAVGQSPIGYSKSHVDALAFIDQKASELKLPVVVNVSQGMNAGAHDGKSMLEIAFDEFSQGGRKPGRVIVKSAGNERDKQGHAEVDLSPNSLETLRWRRDANALVAERLELWWDSANECKFQLATPTGESTPWVGDANQQQNGLFADGTPYSLEFTRLHVDNGDSQLRIKIGETGSLVAPGVWQLKIESGSVPVGGAIHAWIERGVGEPSSFVNHANEKMTLSIPGTAQSVITVGAIEATNLTPVGFFSSYGPTRDKRNKPEIAAPGVAVVAAKAGSDFDAVAKDGTSMAAPFVTGAIALLLSRMNALEKPWPTASQINAALRLKAINYNGQWNPGKGYGIINVAAFLAAF